MSEYRQYFVSLLQAKIALSGVEQGVKIKHLYLNSADHGFVSKCLEEALLSRAYVPTQETAFKCVRFLGVEIHNDADKLMLLNGMLSPHHYQLLKLAMGLRAGHLFRHELDQSVALHERGYLSEFKIAHGKWPQLELDMKDFMQYEA